MRRNRSSVIPGSFEDRTIGGFCIRKAISKSAFYRLPKEVRDKLVSELGPRTMRITPAAEAAFDKAHASSRSTEQRLLAKGKRVAQARKAARAAVAGPNHISKQRRQARA